MKKADAKSCAGWMQVYSLIGGFCASAVNFHAKDGSGYKFLGDVVLQLDKLNPQVVKLVKFVTVLASGVFCSVE